MQNLPKIVQVRLRHAVEATHPDADLLTAFAEQSLGESERGQVMEHLARCGDCREVVALALPASEIAVVPESFAVRKDSLLPAWLTWPALRWGVVAAGILLVTSVGVLQYKERTRQDAALTAGPARHMEKSIAPFQTTQSESPQPQSDVARQAMVVSPEIGKQGSSQKSSGNRSGSQKRANADQPSSGQPSSHEVSSDRPSGEIKAFVPSSQASTEGQAVESLNPAAPTVSAPVAQQTEPSSAVQDEQGIAQNQTESLPQKQAADNNNNLDVVKAKDSEELKAQPSAALAGRVAAPKLSLANGLTAAPRWAIGSSGVLQRSFDAGATWEAVDVNQNTFASDARMESTAEAKIQSQYNNQYNKKTRTKEQPSPVVVFRAVVALGPEVWAGGSSAMLYHSLDSGNHWTRVVPLESNGSLTGEIVSIEFLDPRHGTVATSAGEVWLTADNGQTWHKQR